jgi:signal transduction histidine kinase
VYRWRPVTGKTDLARARKRVEAAWRSFIVDGRLPGSVRPEIVRSWQRARAAWQVDPALLTCPRALNADDLRARTAAEEVFRAASRVVSHFADRLAPDGHVVAFFDRDGVMVTLDGNHRTRSRLADVNFAPGACWAEKTAGTNGPGTALVEARPMEVFASEHFVEAWQPWSCASVPVRFDGHVVGAVDITSPWTARNPSLLLTAEALALAIESQLEAAAARRQSATLLELARDSARERDDFLAVLSHEVKTPLTPLRLAIQKAQRLVAGAVDGLDPVRLDQALRHADRHIGRLVSFIDDVAETARLGDEPLRLSVGHTDLGATVRGVVARCRGELERTGCQVAVTVPSEVVGRWDAARIAHALKNLLVNAMKYAPGPIEVEVTADDVAARVVVRDHGPGIAAADRERIFLPFERAVSCRNVAGFGLGLTAVRQIVEAHGGTVRLESAPGGSAFVVELPLRGHPQEQPPA